MGDQHAATQADVQASNTQEHDDSGSDDASEPAIKAEWQKNLLPVDGVDLFMEDEACVPMEAVVPMSDVPGRATSRSASKAAQMLETLRMCLNSLQLDLPARLAVLPIREVPKPSRRPASGVGGSPAHAEIDHPQSHAAHAADVGDADSVGSL